MRKIGDDVTGSPGSEAGVGSDDDVIFRPTADDIARSQLTDFVRFVGERYRRAFDDHAAFHTWSVRNFRDFWACFLSWSGVICSGHADPICDGDDCESATFFPNLGLNYTENLLASWREEDRIAVSAASESGQVVGLTGRALDEQVRRVAAGMRRLGVGEGDRVVAIAKNDVDAIVAALATIGLGATWSSVAPDLGAEAVLRRFRPLEPKLLFTCRAVCTQGVTQSKDALVQQVVGGLSSLEEIVSFDASPPPRMGPAAVHTVEDLRQAAPVAAWTHFPFNQPAFVLFSSGTTGEPKCIVHGAGGTLLEHLKEHRLHADLGGDDRLYFHTTCGWMMWNWQLSALASGTTLVVYDGSATHPRRDALWQMAAEQRVTVLGTSPAYLQYCRGARLKPGRDCDLSRLRLIQSTGSILYDDQYDWIVENVKRVPIHSISGGTDIIGCFVLGNPNAAVYRGESQCRSLGMDVRAFVNEAGGLAELVCANPFPSRPVGFFRDPEGRRFHEAYFMVNEGVWTHGDFVEETAYGGVRLLGRSDGVLNVRGVRIGPAEIYHVVQSFGAIEQCLAVDQRWPDAPGGSRVVLLVVMAKECALDAPLVLEVKEALRHRASPAHVPAVIVAVSDLPTTFSGKLSERAACDAVNGEHIRNHHALSNPVCLEEIRSLPALG